MKYSQQGALQTTQTPPETIEVPRADLATYARLFPWTCIAVCIATGLPAVLFDATSTAYSERIAWSNGLTALVSGGLGIWAFSKAKPVRHTKATQEILLGGLLLTFMAFNNLLLLLDTAEPRHALAGALTMLCAGLVYPGLLGVAVVSLPQLALVAWLTHQAGGSSTWLFAFFTTLGGALVGWVCFYTRAAYFRAHNALLQERARITEALERESVERTLLQERVLTERTLSTLGRLAGGIAHDLNNILVPILGNAAMLEESVQTSTHKRQAKEVMRAATRARSLTQQLGNFSLRSDAKNETLDLNRTVTELSQIVWRTFPQGIDIDLNVQEVPLYLQTNRIDLQDLVTTLLLDASSVTPSGSVIQLQVFPNAEPPDEFDPPTERSFCAITVADGAAPMSAEQRAALFDPSLFTTDHDRGFGLLGARDKARALGGYLGVDSSAQGTNQFCLFLPKRSPEPTTRTADSPEVSAAVAPEILVVDDEPAVRDVTAQLLKRAGFLVRECESGEKALEEIDHHLPDAIVLDLRMPGMGGRAVAESIRKHNNVLPIIVCTGFTGDAEGWLGGLPNCALLPKPYDKKDLIAAVNGLLVSPA